MDILPSNDKNFNAMAAAVLKLHLDSGRPYSECVAEVAESEGLTPEETRRLVEKANTALSIAHLRSEDRKANFGLASVEEVLGLTHSPAGDAEKAEPKPSAEEKTASFRALPSLPKTRKRAVSDPFAGLYEKTAEATYDVGRELGALKRRLESLSLVKVAFETAANGKFLKLASLVDSMPEGALAEFTELCVSSPETRRLLPAVQAACRDGSRMDKCAEAGKVLDDTSVAYSLAREIAADLDSMEKSAAEIVRLSETREALRKAAGRRPC